MKKLIKLGLVFGFVVLATGCGNNVTKCTIKNDQGSSGYTIDTTYEIYSKGDNVDKVEIKEVITSKNNTTLAYFEDKFKKKYEELNKNYKGYTVKSSVEKGKAIVTATADYNKIDVTKFANDNDTIKSDIKKSKKMTTKIMKKYYESLGASCK